MSDRKTKTWLQDLHDSFWFLYGNRAAPFLIVLPHASSRRHLRKMIREWFPAHWQLGLDDFEKMLRFWGRWYKDLPDSNLPDWLVREHVRLACDAVGLHWYYLNRILPHEKNRGFNIQFSRQIQRHDQVYWFDGEASTTELPVQIIGKEAGIQCFYLTSSSLWRIVIFVDHQPPIDERFAHYFSKAQVDGISRSVRRPVEVCFDLESQVLSSLVKQGDWLSGNPHIKSHRKLVAQPGFAEQLKSTLSASGLDKLSFLPLEYKRPLPRCGYTGDYETQGHH